MPKTPNAGRRTSKEKTGNKPNQHPIYRLNPRLQSRASVLLEARSLSHASKSNLAGRLGLGDKNSLVFRAENTGDGDRCLFPSAAQRPPPGAPPTIHLPTGGSSKSLSLGAMALHLD